MRSSFPRAAALVGAIVLVSVWASGWQRFTWGARLGTLGCALVVLGIGLALARSEKRAGTSAEPGPDVSLSACDGEVAPGVSRAGLAMWIAVLAVAAVWDVLGLLTPPNRHHLTLSAIEMAYRPLHGLLFALWLGVGWVLASQFS
jgi:hypothetical protein